LFLFVRKVPPSIEPLSTLGGQIRLVIKVAKAKEMLMWVVYIAAWGYSLGFGFSRYPTLVDVFLVPWAFTLWGGVFLVSSIIFGKLLNYIPMWAMIMIHGISMLACVGGVALGTLYDSAFFVTGAIFGLNEGLGNIVIISGLMKMLPRTISGALSLFRFIGCITIGISIILQLYIDWRIQLIIITVLTIIGVAIAMVGAIKFATTTTTTVSDNDLDLIDFSEASTTKV